MAGIRIFLMVESNPSPPPPLCVSVYVFATLASSSADARLGWSYILATVKTAAAEEDALASLGQQQTLSTSVLGRQGFLSQFLVA